MKTRIAGVLSILIGLAAAISGAWGFITAESMASLPAPASFDAEQWTLHWRTSSAIMSALGIGLIVSGAALFRSRRLGYLLLATAVIISALVPWMFIVFGFGLYAFEQPRVLESVILLAVGIAALVAYRSLRQDVDDLRTASSATHAKPRANQGER